MQGTVPTVVALSLSTAGCMAVYQPPAAKPLASLAVESRNDSADTFGRTVYVRAYANEACEQSPHGFRAGESRGNTEVITTQAQSIIAGEPFLFSANYIDSRFAQNRACSVTGAFTPASGRKYLALLLVRDNVKSCDLGIYDVTTGTREQIEFSMPPKACTDSGQSKVANGGPLWTDWRVKTAP